MNDYEQKKADRIERLRERAQSSAAKGNAALDAARAIGERIPFGQPILVGHHSERRHRRDIDRIDAKYRRGFEALSEAKDLTRRADAAEANTAISSDDPSAIARLEAKLVEVRAEHAREVAGNKAIRAAKGDREAATRALLALGFSSSQVDRALMTNYGDKVYGFFVGNAAASIRATEKRLAELRAAQVAPEREPLTIGGATMTWDRDANRVQLRFPGKPDASTAAALKVHGFRWAPSVGVWQRHASEQAWYRGERIMTACVESAQRSEG
jgi:hypothetical protein